MRNRVGRGGGGNAGLCSGHSVAPTAEHIRGAQPALGVPRRTGMLRAPVVNETIPRYCGGGGGGGSGGGEEKTRA